MCWSSMRANRWPNGNPASKTISGSAPSPAWNCSAAVVSKPSALRSALPGTKSGKCNAAANGFGSAGPTNVTSPNSFCGPPASFICRRKSTACGPAWGTACFSAKIATATHHARAPSRLSLAGTQVCRRPNPPPRCALHHSRRRLLQPPGQNAWGKNRRRCHRRHAHNANHRHQPLRRRVRHPGQLPDDYRRRSRRRRRPSHQSAVI